MSQVRGKKVDELVAAARSGQPLAERAKGRFPAREARARRQIDALLAGLDREEELLLRQAFGLDGTAVSPEEISARRKVSVEELEQSVGRVLARLRQTQGRRVPAAA